MMNHSRRPQIAAGFLFRCFAVALLCGGISAAFSETLRYSDLVCRLTDLEQLAVAPQQGERAALASSYDRASKYDAATDRYIAWDANSDGSGIVRKEGDNTVLANIAGSCAVPSYPISQDWVLVV